MAAALDAPRISQYPVNVHKELSSPGSQRMPPSQPSEARRPPTMRDVAQRAAVSVQTVSRVVNDERGIAPATRARVLAAIRELGYRPHGIARSLRTGRTGTIALLVPHVSRPFFASVTSVVEQVVMERGYSLVVYSTRDDPDREAKYLELIAQNWVDGVLYVTTDYFNNLSILAEAGIAAVAIDRQPQGYQGPAVLFDNYRSGRVASEYLLSLGHRRIALIESASPRVFAQQQLAGICDALGEASLHLIRLDVPSDARGAPRGYWAAKALLTHAPSPTAIIATDDWAALGVLRYALENGLRVPGDLSILAMNEHEILPYTTPSLTAIVQPIEEMVLRAFGILQELIAGQPPPEFGVALMPRLVCRESTGAPSTR